RPLALDDVLAVGIELVRDQRVERPALPRAVTVHYHDLGRAGSLRAAHRRVDLVRVEPPPFLVQLLATRDLLPLHDPGNALHVADHVDAHARSLCRVSMTAPDEQSSTIPAPREGRLELPDERILAWREYGPPEGRPVLRFQGTPGSRKSRHPHEESYVRL